VRKWIVAFCSLVAGVYILVPLLAERKMKVWLNSGCSRCVDWRKLDLGWTSFRFEGFQFQSGDPRDSAWKAEIASLAGTFSPWALLSGKIEVGNLSAERAEVSLTEGPESFPARRSSRSSWVFQVKATQVKNSKFTYQRNYSSDKALIRIQSIFANAGPWGNADPETLTHAMASGILESSGKFTLAVGAEFFDPKPQAEVELNIRRQNLAAVNPYFLPATGIALRGDLKRGRAVSHIQGKRQKAWVLARYRGLRIDVRPHEGRSKLQALLMSLGADLSIADSSFDRDLSAQVRGVTLSREKESIVAFVFRAWKKAAMGVAKGD
jgi:hypothetical protein